MLPIPKRIFALNLRRKAPAINFIVRLQWLLFHPGFPAEKLLRLFLLRRRRTGSARLVLGACPWLRPLLVNGLLGTDLAFEGGQLLAVLPELLNQVALRLDDVTLFDHHQ